MSKIAREGRDLTCARAVRVGKGAQQLCATQAFAAPLCPPYDQLAKLKSLSLSTECAIFDQTWRCHDGFRCLGFDLPHPSDGEPYELFLGRWSSVSAPWNPRRALHAPHHCAIETAHYARPGGRQQFDEAHRL